MNRSVPLPQGEPQYDADLREAIATILVMVMPIDGHSHPRERERLLRILGDDFELPQDELEALVGSLERSKDDGKLDRAAQRVRASLGEDGIINLISNMWEMVFADGRIHESEVLLVERTAQLLDVSPERVARLMLH